MYGLVRSNGRVIKLCLAGDCLFTCSLSLVTPNQALRGNSNVLWPRPLPEVLSGLLHLLRWAKEPRTPHRGVLPSGERPLSWPALRFGGGSLDDGEWRPKLGWTEPWWDVVEVVGDKALDGDTSEVEVTQRYAGIECRRGELLAYFQRSSMAPELKKTVVVTARDALVPRLLAQPPREALYRGCGRSDWTQVDALQRD